MDGRTLDGLMDGWKDTGWMDGRTLDGSKISPGVSRQGEEFQDQVKRGRALTPGGNTIVILENCKMKVEQEDSKFF